MRSRRDGHHSSRLCRSICVTVELRSGRIQDRDRQQSGALQHRGGLQLRAVMEEAPGSVHAGDTPSQTLASCGVFWNVRKSCCCGLHAAEQARHVARLWSQDSFS